VIICLSTSSAFSSVAVVATKGAVLWSGAREAKGNASAACIGLLEESGYEVSLATGFLADLGPGSFTGVRVGVTLAKTFAWALGVKCGGVDSFDLIDPFGMVVFPSKKGEWFVRVPGVEVVRQTELPEGKYSGFGPGIEPPNYPNAAGFSRIMDRIRWIQPEGLAPEYLIEPSISLPKNPGQVLGRFGGNVPL